MVRRPTCCRIASTDLGEVRMFKWPNGRKRANEPVKACVAYEDGHQRQNEGDRESEQIPLHYTPATPMLLQSFTPPANPTTGTTDPAD